MPKSAKHRKAKTADFSKAKLKLGKGKVAPSNALDTTFKARSIVLTPQTITVEKNDATPTTRRKLNLDDLLLHLKHYSGGVRKDAIIGLRELLEVHPEVIEPNLTSVFKACARLIGDDDHTVRKSLLTFFGWLLSRLPTALLIPHGRLLLLSTASAQTSITPEIRIDAVQFLDLLLQHMPDQVVSGWARSGESGSSHSSRVLDGYMSLLNAGRRFSDDGASVQSTVTMMLSPASKALVLKSLGTFIRHMTTQEPSTSTSSHINPADTTTPTWYFASSFPSHDSFLAFTRLLETKEHSSRSRNTFNWSEDAFHEDFVTTSHLLTHEVDGDILQSSSRVHALIASLAELDPSTDNVRSKTASVVHSLCRALQPILISTFLECAPSVFSPSHGPPEAETEMVLAVGRIACGLYRALLSGNSLPKNLQEDVTSNLKDLLSHLAAYFPFRDDDNEPRNLKTSFQELNVIYCELSSLLVLVGPSTRPRTQSNRRKGKGDAFSTPENIAKQRSRVGDYVERCLQGSGGSVAIPLHQPLTPSMYAALLPTIWSLLNDEATSSTICQTLFEHAVRTSSTSGMKRTTLEFIARLLLVQSDRHYQGSFRIAEERLEDSNWQKWVMHLPQTLWELGGTNVHTTEIILVFLLRFLQRKPIMGGDEIVIALRARFIPFFFLRHSERDRIGPYAKLPTGSPARRLALDVVVMICMNLGVDEGLVGAVEKAVSGSAEATYWEQLRQTLS